MRSESRAGSPARTWFHERTLTLDGTNVIPANDPIGDEINLTEEEIEWYKELGVYYESLSKNIDADNDDVLTFLIRKTLI